LRIAEDAKQKAADYMSAKVEVESFEKLAQALYVPACGKLLLTHQEDFKNDPGQPQGSMATVSKVYYRAGAGPVLLPPERAWFSWQTTSKSQAEEA
jgi:hypothetical protein